MEVSASSPEKNEELTLALKTWSKLEEETTGRFKGRDGLSGPGSGFGTSSREGGDWMGIAERKMDSGSGVRRTGGGTAVEVDNQDDDNDGTPFCKRNLFPVSSYCGESQALANRLLYT